MSKSQVEWDMVPTARALLDSDGATIVLPNDVVLAALHPLTAAATAPAAPRAEVRVFSLSVLLPSPQVEDAPACALGH